MKISPMCLAFIKLIQITKDPELIEEITYREMRELSYAGFSVFHDEPYNHFIKIASLW